MGNYRFRFSDMMPNAWFYKLKDMNYRHKNQPKISNPTNKKRTPSSFSPSSSSSPSSPSFPQPNHPDKPHLSDQRKSYYFSRELSLHPNSPTQPPRKSSGKRSTKRNRRPPPTVNGSSSISASCHCGATVEEDYPNSPSDQTSSSGHESTLTEYGSDRGLTANTFDIVIDVDHLPPIITKRHEPVEIQRSSAELSEKNKYGALSVRVVKENFLIKDQHKSINRKPIVSPGVKLRTNSPRIGIRRIQNSGRKSGSRRSVSESFAVVKASKDPGKDFRESMMEMIVENNITASKDLEELLACYLSLNSDEYHELIIDVFKQIWFDFVHVK